MDRRTKVLEFGDEKTRYAHLRGLERAYMAVHDPRTSRRAFAYVTLVPFRAALVSTAQFYGSHSCSCIFDGWWRNGIAYGRCAGNVDW